MLQPLGRGSMGSVYLAEHTGTRQRVALKVLRAGILSPHLRQRFLLEADLLRRLDHPGIAHIFEVGSFDTRFGQLPYFAMEVVEGHSLRDFRAEADGAPAAGETPAGPHGERKPRPRATDRGRFQLLAAICAAVHHAHEQGVIHRDLKPENIPVDLQGQPKVLDFGVARLLDVDPRATTLMTSAGQLVGTLQYMSPEQAGALSGPVDRRTDVYALGVIAYELLAGRRPYDVPTDSLEQAIVAILRADPVPLGTVRPELAGAEVIVEKAMQLRPGERYATAGEMAADFQRLLAEEPLSVQRADWPRRMARRVQRALRERPRLRRALLATAVALPLAVTGVIVATGLVSRGGGPPRVTSHSSPVQIQTAYDYVFDRVNDASRDIQRGPDTRERLEAAIASLKEVRKYAAGLPERPYSETLIRLINWRLGEACYFIGKGSDDPAALQEAVSYWAEAAVPGSTRLTIEGVTPNHTIIEDMARVGYHHPPSNIALATEALAYYRTPKRNLQWALEQRIAAAEILRANGPSDYPASDWAAQNYREDRGLVLNDLAGSYLRLGALTDSVPLLEASLRTFARADSGSAIRIYPSPTTAFLTAYGNAWLEHADRVRSRAEVDSALARYGQALAMNDAGSAPLSYAGIKRGIARAYRLTASLAPDSAASRRSLEEALVELHYATAALAPDEDATSRASIWREEAFALGDLARLTRRVAPLVRADSLLEAAGTVLPPGKYPAQASAICYEKGRVARIRWEVARREDDRARALRDFRDAGEIMPEAQNPGLHRRIREELGLLGATGAL